MKYKKNDVIRWWSSTAGWKTFRVIDIRERRIDIRNRHGDVKTVDVDKYRHRIRRIGLFLLIPWTHPSALVYGQGKKANPMFAPRRKKA